jgi:hypothetical protein
MSHIGGQDTFACAPMGWRGERRFVPARLVGDGVFVDTSHTWVVCQLWRGQVFGASHRIVMFGARSPACRLRQSATEGPQ